MRFGRPLARRIRRSRRYVDHDNAACTSAVALLHIGPRSGRLGSRERDAVVAHAVAELHAAIDAADRGLSPDGGSGS